MKFSQLRLVVIASIACLVTACSGGGDPGNNHDSLAVSPVPKPLPAFELVTGDASFGGVAAVEAEASSLESSLNQNREDVALVLPFRELPKSGTFVNWTVYNTSETLVTAVLFDVTDNSEVAVPISGEVAVTQPEAGYKVITIRADASAPDGSHLYVQLIVPDSAMLLNGLSIQEVSNQVFTRVSIGEALATLHGDELLPGGRAGVPDRNLEMHVFWADGTSLQHGPRVAFLQAKETGAWIMPSK
ncbi:MAG: hypothetical protein AB7J35_21255 [Dehalococcoidia bacterium]